LKVNRIIVPSGVFFMVAMLNAQTAEPASNVERTYEFGKVGVDAEIQHTFTFTNTGSAALEIKDVQLSPPLVVTKMPARIEPGAEAKIAVEMQKPLKYGGFYGGLEVHFKDESRKPEKFYVEGEIVAPVEFIPHNVIFLSTQRGQPKSSVVEIVNHEPEPMEILNSECNLARFDCELSTLEPGRRYSLKVTLKGEGPGDQQTDTIVLPTKNSKHRLLEVRTFSKIRERVYAFPDSLDLETVDVNYLKSHPQMVGFLNQNITVFQAGGTGFQISAETDIPFLRIATHISKEFKDRAGILVSVDPDKVKAGPVKGAITVSTNDPDFPKLVIPVSATGAGSL